MARKRRPWERQENEGERPWQLFQLFLDQEPPRRLADVAAAVGISLSAVETHSSKRGWFKRAAEWDNHLANVRAEATIKEARRRRLRHLDAVDAMIEKGLDILAAAGADEAELRDGRQLLTDGIKLSQLLSGEATERVEQTGFGDLSKLSAEEIRQLRELKRKASASADAEE